eukprot:4064219-Amphidinium_carterae.1
MILAVHKMRSPRPVVCETVESATAGRRRDPAPGKASVKPLPRSADLECYQVGPFGPRLCVGRTAPQWFRFSRLPQ